ncbi:helix-turn-helix transcriptional regulator [Pinibacter soli]|uniref:Helix-turn-helix transcriptional regulator n=1 Tax=Pinibacter soli TaxID=3044211 RepID=A0ABT6RJB8_9BACT|nr:helix-turn-helix transcriptional regulator [Pinibacter soli]MDI3322618.1 helix-turn-helix transcriptional regulator [Pinibacter soli]
MKHHFASNLRYLRKRKGVTQTEIAILVEKAHTTIGNWEKRIAQPNIEELVIISDFFQISLDRLIVDDLALTSYNFEHSQAVKEEQEAYLANTGKLIDSLQLNVDTLKQLMDVKDKQIAELMTENMFLKQGLEEK